MLLLRGVNLLPFIFGGFAPHACKGKVTLFPKDELFSPGLTAHSSRNKIDHLLPLQLYPPNFASWTRVIDFQCIQAKHKTRLKLILSVLDNAADFKDINFPGSNLHELKGKLKGHLSVKVNGNWRITFKFENGDAYIVNYQDYH